jgi:hypothetical protein
MRTFSQEFNDLADTEIPGQGLQTPPLGTVSDEDGLGIQFLPNQRHSPDHVFHPVLRE